MINDAHVPLVPSVINDYPEPPAPQLHVHQLPDCPVINNAPEPPASQLPASWLPPPFQPNHPATQVVHCRVNNRQRSNKGGDTWQYTTSSMVHPWCSRG